MKKSGKERNMSLGTVVRSLLKNYRNRFPGASDEHLRALALKRFEVALDNPKAKDEETAALTDLALEEAAELGEEWAVELKNSFRNGVVRPIVAKALERGADPMDAVRYELGKVDESEFGPMVAELVDELTAKQDASVPAQAASAEGDADDADEAGSTWAAPPSQDVVA